MPAPTPQPTPAVLLPRPKPDKHVFSLPDVREILRPAMAGPWERGW
jgi:hypothetical protein